MPERLRIFISSPGDVAEERLRAHLVVQKLARDYARFFKIEAYLWEHEPMLASGHFQDAIEPPSASDVVLLIVYSRLGTPLPERTDTREYRGIDGRAPVTGTEWEYEEALAAHRAKGAPDLLAYRKVGDPGASLTDAALRSEQERQWKGLESFWRRHFEDSGMFLAGAARFATLEDFDQKLEADLTALIERKIAARKKAGKADEESAWFRGNPYQGLAAYEFEHAAIFFGRDAQIRAAVTRLQAAAERGTAFLFVAGGSGSGKSSLARAGVLPAIVAPKAVPGVGLWRRVVTRAGDGGDDPVLGLARALLSGDPDEGIGLPELAGAGSDPAAFAAHLKASADDPSFPFRTALGRIADGEKAAGRMLAHENARLILLVDQLEELFAPRVAPEQRDLYARILAGLARSGAVWTVATMRSDLWHRAAEARVLVDLIEAGGRLDLQVPDGAHILETVRRPAAAAGIEFESDSEAGVGLDAVIASEAAEDPGALPLLSVMLHALYQRDIVGADAESAADTLTFKSYRALGELKGAIAKRAEETLEALRERDPEAADAFPVVLRNLVTVSPDRETVTARSARLDQFPEGGPEARLITAFLSSDARLFVATGSEAGAEVRVAHEALLSHWPRAAEQIATDRRDLETRARLESLQHRWAAAADRREKKQSLLTGLNLAEGRDLVRRWRIAGSPLGNYVAQSQSAATFRRRALSAAAAVLIVIFAGLAGVAGLQWKRAEGEAQLARLAEETERVARAEAEEQRQAAEVERQRAETESARATENENRAVAALEETKRETARTLASQAELSLLTHDAENALELAVAAAEAEADVLEEGDVAASEPALLKAMAVLRQELHIQRPTQNLAMPYDFLGDGLLLYVDPEAGLVVVDMADEPSIRMRIPLPDGMIPTHLNAFNERQWVAVGGGTTLFVAEADSGRIRYRAELPAVLTAIDVDEESGAVAIGFGAMFAIVAADQQGSPTRISVPEPRDGVNVGQVRFSADGKTLFVTYGPDVFSYDLATRTFRSEPVAQLSAASVGGEQALLEELLRTGIVVVTELVPDLDDPSRLYMMGALELASVTAAPHGAHVFDRSDPNFLYLGLSLTDQADTGSLQELVAVLGRTDSPRQDFQLSYVDSGGTLLPLEAFSLTADALAGEKPYSCKVSLNVTHLACHYWGDSLEGLVVWRLLGGNHRFERVLGNSSATSAVSLPEADATLVTTRDNEIVVNAQRRETIAGSLEESWTLSSAGEPYVVGHSVTAGEARIWRFDAAGRALQPVAEGPSIAPPMIDLAEERALFVEADRLTLRDLNGGTPVWSTETLAGITVAAFSPEEGRAAALTADGVTVVAMGDGAVEATHAVTRDEGSPAAFDKDARRLAFVSGGVLTALDVSSGEARAIGDVSDVSVLAWTPDGGSLIVGRRDGGVLSINVESGTTIWSLRSPLGDSFSEDNAWPDQPPKGLVLSLALSPEGTRLAVVRQDIPALDIYEAATGRLLTSLTPPWSFGVPAHVSLPDETQVVTGWAVHAMTRHQASAVSVHRLPATFEETLAAARERLEKLKTIWSPSGIVSVAGANAG